MNSYLPKASVLFDTMRLTPARYQGSGKAVVELRVLRAILDAAIRGLPYDEGAYRRHNPDLAAAADSGQIEDLRSHYVSHGYFESRVASDDIVDEAWYTSFYADVGEAVAQGEHPSGQHHYLTNGEAEWRAPSLALKNKVDEWQEIVQRGDQ